MVSGSHRPTKLIIDTQAISENVSQEVARLPKESELFAVVKANGYGHGAVQTALSARRGGATGFCVSLLDEGIELREAGITEPILILGVVESMYIDLIVRYELSVTAATQEWLEEAQQILAEKPLAQQLKIHIKVDTGMGRIGFTSGKSALLAVETVRSNPAMEWEGIFTHFATADAIDAEYFTKQEQMFKEIIQQLPEQPRYIHSENSAAALWHPESPGNMIRFGIAMYGLNPSGRAITETYPLKPAMQLKTKLIQVKELPQGAGVGYGKTYTVSAEKEWIGTLPIGYADGWLRHMQGFYVLVNGKKCEIIGRVCMDQCMVRLPEYVPDGTEVTLVGESQGEVITMQMVADQLSTIHYEVVCTFSQRIQREYK
ncbi:alanine racemase [Enterococcus sp. BWR-S5]|uniref:alanine racemase n=1 Tax=Enterococcus sp. BWR-S5 TaxID=2787714 RepID=UPI001921852E|nr:alanine racemase [Enterococcus sp. BWR-S5]MBL1223566.1 alanine racemase [Enterococcus sp. BWR-S5]